MCRNIIIYMISKVQTGKLKDVTILQLSDFEFKVMTKSQGKR